MNRRLHTHLRIAAGAAIAVASAVVTVAAPASGAQVGPTDDFQVSVATPTPSNSHVAYNATDEEYLVVWASVDASLESRIWGRVIDARTGAGVTGEFLIAEMNGGDPTTGHIEPDVVWNSVDNEYVVVSAADDTVDTTLIVTTFEIYAQRVSAAGALVGASVRVSDLGTDDTNGSFDANQPAIAHDPASNQYLVVFDGDDDTAPLANGHDEIFGQLLAADLTVPAGAGNDVRLSDMGADGDGTADARGPAVAWDGTQYLAVWEGDDDSTTFEIHGQYVADDGTESGSDFLISTDTANNEAYDAAVAANPVTGDVMVVWEHDDGAGNDFEVEGAFVNGTPGTSFPISEVGTAAFSVEMPAVAYHPTTGTYSVVWAGDHATLTVDNEFEVFHVLLDGTGAEVEAVERISTMGTDGVVSTSVGHPDVAAGPDTASGVVWAAADGAVDTEVWGQFVGLAADLEVVSKTLTSAANPGPGDPVVYEITYINNGPADAFNVRIADPIPTDVTINNVSSTGATLIPVVGENLAWDIASLPSGSGGTITLTGVLAATATDGALIANTATISAGPLGGDAVPANDSKTAQLTVDYPPSVTIDQGATQPDPITAGPVVFDVVFSEDVTGFDSAGDVTLSGTAPGMLSAVITPVSATAYTVTVSGMTGDGTVIASIAAGVANDTGPSTKANTASTSTDNTVTLDATPPTVTVEQAAGQDDPTNASPINFTATFSEDVSGFVDGDVTLGGTAGATTATVTGGPAVYNIAVSGMTGDGTVTAGLAAAVVTDLAGNANEASTSTDNTVDYDATAPTVTIEQAAGQTDPTSGSPINFTATFSEDVSGFVDADVTLGGTAGATTATVTGGPATYTVAVSGMTGDGTVTAGIAGSVASDAAGNGNAASTSADNEVTYDATAPTPVIATTEPDPTNTDPFDVTIDFGETVSGFVDTDITVGNGTVTNLNDDGGGMFTATIDATTDGTVTVDIAANVATDAAGTGNAAASQFTIDVDTTAPTLVIEQAVGQVDPTNATTVEFTATASEDVTGLADADIGLTGPAAVGATAVVTGGPAIYTVTVSGITADGDLTASIVAGAATDAAGNASVTNPSADPTVTVDLTVPTVTVEQAAAQLDPANGSSVLFDVTFSEDVTGFDVADLAVTGSSGASSAGAVIGGSGATYTVEITDIPADGDVVLAVIAGAASDAAGNTSEASSSVDNSVLVDRTVPTVSLEQGATQSDSANTSPIVFDVVFSEDVTGFDGADVTIAGSAGATTATVTPIDAANYTVEISGMTGDGTVIATVAAAAAMDAAGNDNEASTSIDNMVTYIAGDVTPGVNDAPVITAPAAAAAELAEAVPFSGADAVSVTDPDAIDADIVVTLTADDDETVISVTATTGVAVTGNDSDVVSLTGSQSDINLALASLTITANNVGDVTVTVAVDDQGNTDGAALTDSADIVITVTDTTPPRVTVPAAVVSAVTDPGRADAIVEFDVIVDDPGSQAPARLIELQAAPTLDCDPSSGDFFPIGDTTVTCTATDASGNSTVESFVVSVTDDEAPVISGAADQSFTLPTGTSGPVTYTAPTATDNSGSATITCTPASGSTLSVGATTVNCTASDASGNTSSASFQLTVATTARIPDTGGSLTLLPWAVGLFAAGLLLLGSIGVSRRYGVAH